MVTKKEAWVKFFLCVIIMIITGIVSYFRAEGQTAIEQGQDILLIISRVIFIVSYIVWLTSLVDLSDVY
jgi:uncharacterized MAPEG superfamily protein